MIVAFSWILFLSYIRISLSFFICVCVCGEGNSLCVRARVLVRMGTCVCVCGVRACMCVFRCELFFFTTNIYLLNFGTYIPVVQLHSLMHSTLTNCDLCRQLRKPPILVARTNAARQRRGLAVNSCRYSLPSIGRPALKIIVVR